MTKAERIAKKQEQELINEKCVTIYNDFLDDYKKTLDVVIRPLRYCQAEALETNSFYALRSYSTIVAIIPKYTHELYDILRLMYGYTATSVQHISKFRDDYIYYRLLSRDCETYTWRSVN